MSFLWLLLAFVWAFGVDLIEDHLPANGLGALTMMALCLLNPFAALFIWSLVP